MRTRSLGILLTAAAASAFASLASGETLSLALVGDAGYWSRLTQQVRDAVLRSGVQRLVLPGDNLYEPQNDTYEKVWAPWKQKGLLFEMAAIGNHHGGYAVEVAFFGMPAEHFAKVYPGLARFIVLNSNRTTHVPEQMAFADAELTRAEEPFVFLVYHHPTYTLTSYHSWKEKQVFQLAIRPLLVKHRAKLTALLLGHDHIASLVTFGDLPAIVSGATHDTRKPEPRDDVQQGTPVRTRWLYDHKPYWVRLDLDSTAPDARFRFIRAADDHVSCTARIARGTEVQLESDCSVPAHSVRKPGNS